MQSTSIPNHNLSPLSSRQQREKSYKDHEAQHMGSRGDLQAKIDQNTETKLREIDVSMGGMHSAVCDTGVSNGHHVHWTQLSFIS